MADTRCHGHMTYPHDVPVRELVELASRAPSLHNTQPWRWVQEEGALQLHADTARRLQHTDRDGRGLTISCGAALHQLEVAAAGHGWACDIARMPDPRDPAHLATITFEPRAPEPLDTALLHAIGGRRTDRRVVSFWEVPPARVASFVSLAADLGVLVTVEHADDGQIDGLLRQAGEAHAQDEAYQDELRTWVTPFAREEGIPMRNLLTRAAAAKGGGSRFPPGSLVDEHGGEDGAAPTWLVLSTASDDTLSWLRVGEALDSIWLSCTLAGLSVVPFSEPLEVMSTRARAQHDLLHETACPQLLVRIGWPRPLATAPPPTPRRPVAEVLRLAGTRSTARAPAAGRPER